MSSITPTNPQIRGQFRLLVFEVGSKRLATPVEAVRTIADLEEGMIAAAQAEAEGNESWQGKINFIDLASLYFTEELHKPSDERKLIVLKSEPGNLNGVIVDRVFGVGTYETLFPVPSGIFKLPEGVITHIITTEEPWFEVVNIQKIIELNGINRG